jgi:hypothetical protein
MTTYQIKIENQVIPVDADIAQDDNKVRAAMTPFFPGAANSIITRTTDQASDTVTVHVQKKAGTKGAIDPVAHLQLCEGGRNPAIVLWQDMERLRVSDIDPETMLVLDDRIGQAVDQGSKEAAAVDKALERIQKAHPIPGRSLMVGF